jgi:hypothetical protein
MCYGCYEEMGSPKIVNDATTLAARLIDRVYDFSGAGGNAHVVLDDWNLEDNDIRWCLTEGLAMGAAFGDSKEQMNEERACLEALLALSKDERASAMAIYEGWLDAPTAPTEPGN